MTCGAALLSLHDDGGILAGTRRRQPKTLDPNDLFRDILNTSWMRSILTRAVGSWHSQDPGRISTPHGYGPIDTTVGPYSASALS